MRNDIVKTNNFWSKIKRFFRTLFFKEKEVLKQSGTIKVEENQKDFSKSILLNKEFVEQNRKKKIADDIMSGKIMINDLTNNEIDEMIEYFNVYINKMNQEIFQIKNKILKIKDSNF